MGIVDVVQRYIAGPATIDIPELHQEFDSRYKTIFPGWVQERLFGSLKEEFGRVIELDPRSATAQGLLAGDPLHTAVILNYRQLKQKAESEYLKLRVAGNEPEVAFEEAIKPIGELIASILLGVDHPIYTDIAETLQEIQIINPRTSPR